jgi:hypothetical protein
LSAYNYHSVNTAIDWDTPAVRAVIDRLLAEHTPAAGNGRRAGGPMS